MSIEKTLNEKKWSYCFNFYRKTIPIEFEYFIDDFIVYCHLYSKHFLDSKSNFNRHTNERALDIFLSRVKNGEERKTIKFFAEKYNISTQRVRQIYFKTFFYFGVFLEREGIIRCAD